MSSAVVLPSSVTGLSSGGGGALIEFHSARMSAAPTGVTVIAAKAASAVQKRIRVTFMISSQLVVSPGHELVAGPWRLLPSRRERGRVGGDRQHVIIAELLDHRLHQRH